MWLSQWRSVTAASVLPPLPSALSHPRRRVLLNQTAVVRLMPRFVRDVDNTSKHDFDKKFHRFHSSRCANSPVMQILPPSLIEILYDPHCIPVAIFALAR